MEDSQSSEVSSQPNMGLMAWRSGVVRKGDVTVGKNYLCEDEIEELNRLVVMFLDFAEDQARRRKQIFLQNWVMPFLPIKRTNGAGLEK